MKRTINILATTLLLTTAGNAPCQEKPAQQPEQLRYLLNLAGRWQGPATMKMDGKEAHFTYYADFRKIAAGNGLDMHEWGDIPGMGKLDGSNLIGFDPFDGKIHWYSVDNVGTTHEHIGAFTDKDHYTMVHKGTREGKTYVETIQMVFTGKDKLTLNISGVTDGKEDEAIAVVFSRKGNK